MFIIIILGIILFQKIYKRWFLLNLTRTQLINSEVIVCYYWSMICEINLLNIIVIQLLHFAISFPQYTVTESWHPLFLTRVVAVAP